jgi:hypothetical protein
MLAIFSNSFDATSDIVVKHLRDKANIFRFNSDLLSDYSILWKPGYWEIRNLVTLECLSSATLSTAYWRKPLEMLSGSLSGYPEAFYASEIRYEFREIINAITRGNKFRLVEPFAERRVGKFYQLEVASKYFKIPGSLFALNAQYIAGIEEWGDSEVVAKSISGAEVDSKSVLYTSTIDVSSIDTQKPWFLQDLTNADYDITCAYVAGKCFWAKRSRSNMGNILDVREAQDFGDWEPCIRNQHEEAAVKSLMNDLCLDFGRLDFIGNNSSLVFLEVNPNGQYAWLDLDNSRGLITSIIEQIL